MDSETVTAQDIRDSIYWTTVAIAGVVVAVLLIGSGLVWAQSGLAGLFPAKVTAFLAVVSSAVGMWFAAKPDVPPTSPRRLGKRTWRTKLSLATAICALAATTGTFMLLA